METPRGGARQQVPDDFAGLLRALHAADDPLFNTVLAAARSKGWTTPTLAAVLQMNPPAVGKRIERARAGAVLARRLRPLRRLARRRPESPAARPWLDLADKVLMYERIRALSSQFDIPEPLPGRAMIDGRQLPAARIAALREMQRLASRVNGAMPVGHPDRRVSEAFSIALDRLIEGEGFTPYYLAGVLGISHRAVTSRLERHRMRIPCPSVAGTASGVYYGRKIGDPGQGAPRVTPEQRAELRALWQAYTDGARGAKGALAAKISEYTAAGFTLANLAQTISTAQLRVRYGGLRAALGNDRAARRPRPSPQPQGA
jgi:hypothetical protein